jgi:hypothetical protein
VSRQTFRVGERAIIISSDQEVTIVEPLQLCRNPKGRTWFGYPTDLYEGGLQISPLPHQLRKKTKDADPSVSTEAQVGSWDKVGWSPHKQLEVSK